MELNLSHLHPSIKDNALLNDDARLRHINTGRWVSYARANTALERLKILLDYPPCARMPCLLIYGDSGIGKTMIMEKFLRDHPGDFDTELGIERRPIVGMQMPPTPDEKRFYAKL